MSKILVISKWLPYPLTDGGKQAIFNCIKALSTVHEVHLTYFEPYYVKGYEEFISDFKNECNNVTVHRFKEKIGRIKYIKNKFLKLYNRLIKKINGSNIVDDLLHTETTLQVYPNEFMIFIHSLVNDYGIEIVQVEMLANLSLVLGIPNNVKKIFVHHELGFIRNELIFSNKILNLEQQNKIELFKIMEISLLNYYDAIVTLSDIDKSKLIAEGVKCPIYSSFAIVAEKPMVYNENGEIQLLSFVGPESHMPNKDGLIWFLNTCWKELLECYPNMKLQIIGRWSQLTKNDFLEKYDNIVFKGFVDNLADTLQDSIMIVPILVGSGIRMKILEASQIGIPFVTTTVGVEGLPFHDGKDCFIADSSADFVDKIRQLSSDACLRNLMILNAKEIVKNNFSFDALIKNRIDIIQSIHTTCLD